MTAPVSHAKCGILDGFREMVSQPNTLLLKIWNYKYVYAYFWNSAVYKKPKGRNDHKPAGILSHPSIDSAIYYSLSAIIV